MALKVAVAGIDSILGAMWDEQQLDSLKAGFDNLDAGFVFWETHVKIPLGSILIDLPRLTV